MMSSKGLSDVRREKMREEAKKERAQKAKAANILYRKEHKIGDVGFVSRKVAPNAEDAFSNSLKNGLIDYREILKTKEHHYLGIDNDVPGTPEVNFVNFEESYKRIQPIGRDMKHSTQYLNGFKDNNDVLKQSFKVKCSAEKDRKLKHDQQQKTKPPLLTMPNKRQLSPAANKTPKSDPSKIESILKEMIDTAPPLTDIQTPVKTQDSRFPFPHLPQAKESTHPTVLPGKQNSAVKTEEMLKNDLITTSDDDSDDEGHHVTQQAISQRAKIFALSASSSSSSESSSDSSDSENSDSESDSKRHAGQKAIKKPALLQPISSINTPHTANAQDTFNEHNNMPKLDGDKLLTGKVIKSESNEKQVSPLNSAPKEVKRETLEPVKTTGACETRPEKKTNHMGNGLRNNDDIHMNSQFPNEYFDSLQLDPLFDEFGPLFEPNTSLEPQTGLHDESGTLDTIADMMSLGAMQPPFENNLNIPTSNLNFANDNSQLINMMDNSVIGKQSMVNQTLNHTRDNDNFDPVTVDMSALSDWNTDLDNDSYFQKAPIVPNKKKVEKHSNEKAIKKEKSMDKINANRKHANTPHDKLTPSKKNSEHDWFMNILSPNSKKYDLPYVNPEKLKFVGAKETTSHATVQASTPCKAPKSLKVQIPLDKFREKSNVMKPKVEEKIVSAKKVRTGEGKTISAKKIKSGDDKTVSAKKVKSGDDKTVSAKKVKSCGGKTISAKKVKSSETKKVKKKVENKTSKAVGKDIETIKRLMAETSKAPSDHDEFVDVVGTPSPLKKPNKPEVKVSAGKVIHGTPISSSVKKDLTSMLNDDGEVADQKRTNPDQLKVKEEPKHENSRKRTRSIDSFEDSLDAWSGVNDRSTPIKLQSSKQIKIEDYEDDTNVQDMDLEDDDDESDAEIIQNQSVISNDSSNPFHPATKLPVKIDLFRLRRLPGIEISNEVKTEETDAAKNEEIEKIEKDDSAPAKPAWKPPPNIKIPKLTKRTNEVASKQIKNCTEAQQESEHDCSQSNSTNFKQTKEIKEKKTKRPLEGRGVKRKDWDRTSKNANQNPNQNPNVCGMCGALQKDTGRDPIRLGTYKTSYVEFLSMGKRNKRIADCLDPNERAPKYIDAVLKYIHYLVGLEITGKINTKKGVEEYMCITSQCIDLVDYVINQYGKKENNNINSFDDRFVFLCLRLQSVLYFKLFGIKKDSASRYAKLLSEYFKVRRSPHRVSIKGSTGTPSPMSPTSSQNGSVASFGSAGSSGSFGSYDKMSSGNMVSIPADMFERMQQYFTYTKYLLHGQRLWDDAESLSVNCQEFIGIVSRRIGALTSQSSMLHLVDYISTGLEIIKDNPS